MKKSLSIIVALVIALAPFSAFASVGITLAGGPVTLYAGQSYVEPGYSALSTTDGDVTGLVTASSVNTSVAGNTSRTYSVTDSALDSDTQTRVITVIGASAGPLCSQERFHFATSCAGGIWTPGQTKPVVQQVIDGEMMPVADGKFTDFVPSTDSYKASFLAAKAAAQANGTIDSWFQEILAVATYH